ncbi:MULTISPECIES: type II toxin-antitoxin system RatA family toxin [unclassified Streptomyces]|uniref:type II toxin-antitoxin system RatA family toxin n=1 Tax=unclassified Streptomyces TaxID=2593676 RepID=UPI00278BB819|nr:MULTISPECIES: SRPBCC family protein [unclassified Streptomyces]
MRSVHVALAVRETDPGAVFDRVRRFAAYPELVPVVRAVTVHEVSAEEETSDWEVYFRNGILSWTEEDRFDRDELSIVFSQLDGDFESFTGSWRVSRLGSGCRVDFDAEFDFGIPSLAGILDPVAVRVFKETIARIVDSLFGGAAVIDDEAVADALAVSR